MHSMPRRFVRRVAGAILGFALALAPAAAARPLPLQCLLPPGTDSSGKVVGLLIVYPDCRMEVYKPQDPI